MLRAGPKFRQLGLGKPPENNASRFGHILGGRAIGYHSRIAREQQLFERDAPDTLISSAFQQNDVANGVAINSTISTVSPS
jgi:hypothetical protein